MTRFPTGEPLEEKDNHDLPTPTIIDIVFIIIFAIIVTFIVRNIVILVGGS